MSETETFLLGRRRGTRNSLLNCLRVVGEREARLHQRSESPYTIADGYQVYKKLAAENPDLRLANCWAHVLRKFIEIRGNFPAACEKFTDLIGKLYDVERKTKELSRAMKKLSSDVAV